MGHLDILLAVDDNVHENPVSADGLAPFGAYNFPSFCTYRWLGAVSCLGIYSQWASSQIRQIAGAMRRECRERFPRHRG